MGKDKTQHTGGIGFFGVLTLIFITLKLVGKIDWSWWWVLAPVWIPLGLGIGIILAYLVLAAIVKD